AAAAWALMRSRHLAASARGPDDYARVYGEVLTGLGRPAIVHWLGGMFDPPLAGYGGSAAVYAAPGPSPNILAGNAARVDGLKLSLLDAGREVEMRRRLPAGV